METWDRSLVSKVSRILAMRPSIISDGAMMSAPHSAWERATFAKSSRVGSLSTSRPFSWPQWPLLVYWHRQTSPTMTMSGTASRMARMARCTGLVMSQAEEPMSSLYSGRPKISTAGMPSSYTSSAIFTALSTERWYCPGMLGISSLMFSPGTTKSG